MKLEHATLILDIAERAALALAAKDIPAYRRTQAELAAAIQLVRWDLVAQGADYVPRTHNTPGGRS